MKKSNIVFLGIIATLVIGLLFFLVFIVKVGPVNMGKDNSVEVKGTIAHLYEGGVNDLVIELHNDSNIYYINRALENGFDLATVKKELLGEEVILWYAKHRSRPNGGGHMMQLQHRDSLYYTEWQIPLVSTN